jgi:hypothetical protein
MPVRLAILLCALLLALAGCGGDDDSGGGAAAPAEPAPSAQPADFPSAEGKTLAQLSDGVEEGPVFAPSVSQLREGENRLGFALFDTSRKQIQAEAVAVYASKPDGTGLRGPFVARKESIRVDPQYMSRQAAADLEQGDTFYVADVPFPKGSGKVLTALARMDGRLVATSRFELPASEGPKPPDVGDRATRIETLTASDVGGDLGKLTTREPPARAMLEKDFSEVLGKEPVVLMFATPALCQTRVCGPVVDIAEQVRARSGDGVTFIQQEIYEDNDPNKGVREQVAEWNLQSEPWTFVIDRSGRIAERFEGAFSVGELQRAVEKVKAA